MTKGRVDNRDVCWGSEEENTLPHHQVFYTARPSII